MTIFKVFGKFRKRSQMLLMISRKASEEMVW